MLEAVFPIPVTTLGSGSAGVLCRWRSHTNANTYVDGATNDTEDGEHGIEDSVTSVDENNILGTTGTETRKSVEETRRQEADDSDNEDLSRWRVV